MSVIKGTILLTVSSVVFLISGYIINVWLGRHLGPTAYGMYGVVISLMTIVNIIQTAGLPQAVSKFIAEKPDKKDSIIATALKIQLFITIFISTLIFFLAPFLALNLNDVALIPYLQLSAAVFLFYGVYALYIGVFNGLHAFKKQALVSSIYSIVKVVGVIALTLFFGLSGAIGGFIVAPLIAVLFGLYIPKKGNASFPYKKLLLFSLPLIGFSVLSTLQHSIDLFFIKAIVHDSQSSGFFTAAQNIARIPYFGLSAFATVIFPSISQSVSQNLHEKTRKIFNDALRYILILLLPTTMLISSTSSQIVSLLYSKVYLVASSPLSILIFGYGFLTLFTILSNILSGAGSPKTSMIIAGSGAIINSILCYILIPRYGLNGAAIATTIGGGITCTMAGVSIYRKFGTLTYPASAFKIFGASLLVYIVSFLIATPVYLLPLKYAVLGLMYVGLLFVLKEIRQDDKRRVYELVPKRLQRFIPLNWAEENI